MMSNWIHTTIGSFCPFTYGKGLPENKRNNKGNIKVYGSNGVVGIHDQPLVNEPGVVIGRKGTVGSIHFASQPFWPIDTTFYVVGESTRDLRFTYYLLKFIGLEQMNADSAVPGLNRDAAHERRVHVPELPEQRAIAHILGSLDDKIELNRRMNKTLEAMVSTIFKSWFVDFDPVIDNALKAGNPVPEVFADRVLQRKKIMTKASAVCKGFSLSEEISSLFPDSFQDSELGYIPEGWKAGLLGDLTQVIKGRSYTSKELVNCDTALVTLKSFQRGGGYRKDGLKPYIGTYNPEQEVMPGEIVIAQTDVTQRAEIIGKPAIVQRDRNYKTLVASLDTAIVRPISAEVNFPFLYFLFMTNSFQSHTYSLSTGTTVLHLSKQAIPSCQFPFPSKRIMDKFEEIADPLFKRMDENDYEADTLSSLRDTLLPKLISGELRVPDAEKYLEEA